MYLIQSFGWDHDKLPCELEYQKQDFYYGWFKRRGYYEMIQEGLAGSGSYKLSYVLIGDFTLCESFQ